MQKPVKGNLLQRGHRFAIGLIGAWLFNEGTGTLVNDYSGGVSGVMSGGAVWSPGETGHTVNFDGVDGRINIPHKDAYNLVSGDSTILFAYRNSLYDMGLGYVGKWLTGNSCWRFTTEFGANQLTFNRYDGAAIEFEASLVNAALYSGETVIVAGVTRGTNIEIFAYVESAGFLSFIAFLAEVWSANGNTSVMTVGSHDSADDLECIAADIDFLYMYDYAFSLENFKQFAKDPYAMFR